MARPASTSRRNTSRRSQGGSTRPASARSIAETNFSPNGPILSRQADFLERRLAGQRQRPESPRPLSIESTSIFESQLERQFAQIPL